MATSNIREERRRRIVERGSDRLALIKGRTQNIPSLSASSHHFHALDQSSPPTFTSHGHQNPQTILSDQSNAGPEGSADASGSTLLKRETNADVSTANTSDNQVEPQQHNYDTHKEATQTPAMDERTKAKPPLVSSIVQKPSNDTKPLSRPSRNQLNLFSCKQVNSCIIATQGTRSFSALIIALLVVLTYIDYPLFGMNIVSSEGIVASRPIYILLLTDVIIVLAQLYLEERRQSEAAEKERVVSREDGDNLMQAIKVMERGLVLYQTTRAVFIDFSIYTVVVVCGLSLM